MTLEEIFGEGNDLNPLQMSVRALTIFIIALALIRISGNRSFGIKMPFDNVIYILLGAILSRAVVGASPFISTVVAALSIVLLHRFFAWICLYSDFFGRIVKGNSIVLFQDGKIIDHNMKKCEVSEKDLMEAIRKSSNMDSLEKIKQACMERNGEISVILKD